MAIDRLRRCAVALALLLCTACAGLSNVLAVLPIASRTGTGVGGYRVPVRPGLALIETYSAPAQWNFDATKLGARRGSGSVTYFQDPIFTGQSLVSFGEADARSIARSAGITNITHMDYRVVNVLGIFIQFELLVYGD